MAFKNGRLPAPTSPTDPERSALMRRIRSKQTAPERLLRAALESARRSAGLARLPRATWNDRGIVGTPDLAFKRLKIAVFVDGDFWHYRRGPESVPKTNCDYWRAKLEANAARDSFVNAALAARGWQVVRVWASDLDKHPDDEAAAVLRAVLSATVERTSWTKNASIACRETTASSAAA